MEFWLRIGERKGLALATYTFVRYYKIKWWKPPVKPLRHKSFLTSWSSWPYAGRTMILCAMTNQMWCTAFAFLAIHLHLVPSVDNSLHRRKLFPHWRLQPFKMGTSSAYPSHPRTSLVFWPWPHLRSFLSPNCCNCYAIFGNSMWNSVRLVDKHNSARETWCANDLVTFSSRPKDIALYQLDLYFFWILLVCFSWSFRI